MRFNQVKQIRRGVVIPLMALLLIPLLAMMSFSIDIGYAVEVKAELVNATDAAALAGAQQLQASYQQWQAASTSNKSTVLTNAIALAKATATAVANSNKAGGTSVQLVAAEVEVGYTNAIGTYQVTIPSGVFPNTVTVTARRTTRACPIATANSRCFLARSWEKVASH